MIKSNRDIKEIAGFKDLKPQHVEGKVCIDLTDKTTGKVKERIEGKNHVFNDNVFLLKLEEYGGNMSSWVSRVSGSLMCLNDSNDAIDENYPFLRGQTIGYGRPIYGSSGLHRGAYNSANSVLASSDLEKIRWKFQYDFTTAQANGTIKNIGLTRQYFKENPSIHMSTRLSTHVNTPSNTYTGDGRYYYYCSTAGLIYKYDLWVDTVTNIDVSSIVGNVSNSFKLVGYAPRTNKYYVFVGSTTSTNRKMYMFSDNTFATLETTYSPSNISINTSDKKFPLYIYDDYMYYLTDVQNTIYKADFVNNVAYTAIAISFIGNNALLAEGSVGNAIFSNSATTGDALGIYIGALGGYGKGMLYSPETNTPIFEFGVGTVNNTDYRGGYFHPLLPNKTFCFHSYYGSYLSYDTIFNNALTTYILPTPITKTEANGMTATYELEVYW